LGDGLGRKARLSFPSSGLTCEISLTPSQMGKRLQRGMFLENAVSDAVWGIIAAEQDIKALAALLATVDKAAKECATAQVAVTDMFDCGKGCIAFTACC
jgi:hypothetical protein